MNNNNNNNNIDLTPRVLENFGRGERQLQNDYNFLPHWTYHCYLKIKKKSIPSLGSKTLKFILNVGEKQKFCLN